MDKENGNNIGKSSNISGDDFSNPARPRGRPRKELRPAKDEVSGTLEREPQREEDSRDRAARRAAEFRAHRRGEGQASDKFYFDETIVPPGWSYEWKTKFVLGQENRPYYLNLLREGWEPVPAKRHPEMMPQGDYNTIEREGMILMERPLELTEEARRRNLMLAKQQVRAKEAQLTNAPEGTFERDDPRVRPVIKKNFEAIPIPEK